MEKFIFIKTQKLSEPNELAQDRNSLCFVILYCVPSQLVDFCSIANLNSRGISPVYAADIGRRVAHISKSIAQ